MLKCRDFCKANLIAKNRIGVLDVVGQIGPEFFIVDLVHREQHKIQLILILGKESLIIVHRDGLDAELQPRANLDCIAIGSPYARYLSKVAGIIDVGERLARRIS